MILNTNLKSIKNIYILKTLKFKMNKQKLQCPSNNIKINDKREIINTDELQFPWQQDSNGYFLVKIENNKIHCGFVNNKHEMIVEFIGKNPDKMIKEITKRELCSRENLAYISQELMIAYYCMKNNINYIQR